MSHPLLEQLNSSQIEAVLATDGPLLILAGPGSGKTRCLTHKIAYLVSEKKIPPEQILAVTFTNKAASEMKERIMRLTQMKTLRRFPWVGTFHSVCAKILRREGPAIGVPSHFLIYDEADQQQLVKKILKEINLSEQRLNPGAILSAISSAKNELIKPDGYRQLARGFFQEQVALTYPLYQKALSQNNALDFDDLIMEVVRLFEEHPEILATYQQQFRFLLVDEYQDTNRAQYILMKLLAAGHRNLCVVGDPGQSIYAWRGADIHNILQFEHDYPQAKIIKLGQNYRSTQAIIRAASELIRNNISHPRLELWTENAQGENLQLIEAEDEMDEAVFITKTIALDNRSFADFVVLYRTNAQSRVIEEAFLKSHLPYAIVGGTRFYERKEIKDMIAYIRLFVNPADQVSLERGEKNGKRRLETVLKVVRETSLTTVSPLEVLDRILEVTGYLETLKDGTKEGEGRMENVKELRSVATEFKTLTEFLENVALVQQEYMPDIDKQTGEKNQNVVKMMTLHAAKGLEFPVVFIAGLEEGLLPHSRALIDQYELEEERRLCYVGITRAKEKVFLTHARQRLFFGSTSFNEVSRFVEELPQELIEKSQV